jgi:hypothetical protein
VRYTLGTVVLVGMLSSAAASHAQEARKVSIEAQVEVLHDSNVARSSAALAQARGIDRSDTIITPQLAVDVSLPVSRQVLFLRGTLGRSYYQNNDILSSARSDLLAGARLHLAYCEGEFTDLYQHAQTDLQDIDLLTIKNVETLNSVGLNLTCGRSVGFAPTFGVSDTTANNSSTVLRPSDYHTVSTTAGIAYRRPALGEISVFGRHDDTEYRHRLVLAGGSLAQDGFETNSGGIRFVRRTGARIGGEVSVSYSTVNPKASALSDFKGVTYEASVDYRASSRLSATIKLQRSAQPTIRPDAAYSVTDIEGLDVLYGTTTRLKFNAGLSREHDRYKGVAGGGPDLSDETIDRIYAGARLELNRRLAIAATLRHERRDANLSILDYSSSQAGLSLIGKF